ncbi:MAG: A/G-specific adenine glycosylase [Gammaproteobacteria bacterium]|nr:A/G-specific adenine glycosylase [Gammaproteobacteria bacterium]
MLTTSTFSDRLLNWFDQHGRKDLPWQQQPTPYHVWLSEIMLQQTQVSTVIPYYQRFTDRYADIASLAKASIEDVLALWTGLGYYARARNLHKAAVIMTNEHDAKMPNTIEQLIALPGVGRSTAGAIMALAHHQNYPILDGNVKRVLTRYDGISGWPGKKVIENQLWKRAEQLLPKHRIANYIQAQMDLGATVCTRSKPKCNKCPLQSDCHAFLRDIPQNYPSPRSKKIIPTRQINWLVAQLPTKEVLLQQRANTGIWGGLWSFPELNSIENIDHICMNQFNLETTKIVTQTHFRHVLSHFKLDIHPHLVSCSIDSNYITENKNFSWYKIQDALQLGLPAPVKTFLISLQ